MKQEPVGWWNEKLRIHWQDAVLETKEDGWDTPLYTAPTIVKDQQGKVVAVTLTNEEHQVQEVLWQAPRELSNEEMEVVMFEEFGDILAPMQKNGYFKFARAILKKASEK